MQTIKIAILGLGGVGGYYGGKLAQRFRDTSHVEIYFIARGEHLEAIKEYGIHIINENEDFFAKPKLATSDAAEIGPVDYLIITTKSYDLKSSIDQIRPCIDNNTVILPLLNGGDITERIREILPGNTVWSGCSYIVSRRTEPGVIRTSGPFLRLVFGCDGGEDERLLSFEKLLLEAEIDAHYSRNIRESVWKKFYFISVSASLTSYLNVTFNQLSDNPERKNLTIAVADEFLKVAKAEGIHFDETTAEEIVNRTEILPAGTTTSMHSDFKSGNATELETLTGVVVRLAHKHNIPVPLYEMIYSELKNR